MKVKMPKWKRMWPTLGNWFPYFRFEFGKRLKGTNVKPNQHKSKYIIL